MILYHPVVLIAAVRLAAKAETRVEYMIAAANFCVLGVFVTLEWWLLEPRIKEFMRTTPNPLWDYLTSNGRYTERVWAFLGIVIGVMSFGVASNLFSHALTIKTVGFLKPPRRLGSPVVITSKEPIEVVAHGEWVGGEYQGATMRLAGELKIAFHGEEKSPVRRTS